MMLRDYLALTKPRIIVLLLVTGYCAMVVAHGGLPPVGVSLLTALGLFLSCGGANAVNMWYDRDIDQVMARTRGRPIPMGRVRPETALALGFAMEAASFLLLWRTVNSLTAWLALAGFVYYVFIYTMWLKRRTPQNIVIGGGAGAFPPLVGWAAATGQIGLAAILMFLIILFWTPPHVWALALFKQDDYRRAGIPMMPVVRGELATKWQSLAYTIVLLVSSLLLYWTKVVGPYYFVAAWVLGLVFIAYVLTQFREQAPEVKWARRTFHFSLLYLTVLFAVMVLNVRR
jgi:protoheme IX farnesyltransferase